MYPANIVTLFICLIRPLRGDSEMNVKISASIPSTNCTNILAALEENLSSSLRDLCDFGGYCETSRVWINLPSSWAHCVSQIHDRDYSPPGDIILQHTGDKIRSLNPRGCGFQGLEIHLPVSQLGQYHSSRDDGNKSSERLISTTSELSLQMINWKYGLYLEDMSQLEDDTNILSNTRQSMLCEGRSPRELMTRTNLSDYKQPEIIYTLDTRGQHYVLVLDSSKRMEFNSRWRNIKRSLMRFIANIPSGAKLSIITFGKEGSLVLPPTTVTAYNREGLHGRIPRRTEDSGQACISCGLQLASDVLAGSKGSIILLSGTVDVSKKTPNNVYTVMYPSNDDIIVDSRLYSIQENSERSPVTQMNEVLIDIINQVNTSSQLFKIHESNHQSYEFSGTFQLESDQKDAIVTLLIEDEQTVEYFEVINPMGEKNIFPKYEDGAVQVHLPADSKPGIWSYHAKLYPDTSISLHKMSVDVVVRSYNHMSRVQVTGLPNPVVQDLSKPVSILARVHMGEMPVYAAQLTAILSGPDTETEIELQDGNFPDNRVGDGIYTGYLTSFSTKPGYYTVRILASDNNGLASTIQHGSNQQTGTFKYFITSSSFYVNTAVSPGLDIIPPSRISDLSLVLEENLPHEEENSTLTRLLNNKTDVDLPINETQHVQLQFTSPGGDYNIGQAARYEIRCHTNPFSLSNTNFTSHGTLIALDTFLPGPAGTLETVSVPVPWTGEFWYFAIVALDNAGNQGRVSNLVQVFIPTPVEPEPEESSLFMQDANLKLGSNSWFLNTEYMYIIGGCIAGVILCVILLVAFLIHKSKKTGNSKKYLQDDTYEPGGFQPTNAGLKVDKTETESGIYSWLESLPRSEHSSSAANIIVAPVAPMGVETATRNSIGGGGRSRYRGCEEGSNSSRPTTSTDDSISDSGDNGKCTTVTGGEEVSQDDYAHQVLARSLHYYSTRGSRGGDRPAQYHHEDRAHGPHHHDMYPPVSVHNTTPQYAAAQYSTENESSNYLDKSRTSLDVSSVYRKKRHESVV